MKCLNCIGGTLDNKKMPFKSLIGNHIIYIPKIIRHNYPIRINQEYKKRIIETKKGEFIFYVCGNMSDNEIFQIVMDRNPNIYI